MSTGPVPSDRHRVVIIGTGFGGLTAAQELAGADVDITLIADTSHHLFQPVVAARLIADVRTGRGQVCRRCGCRGVRAGRVRELVGPIAVGERERVPTVDKVGERSCGAPNGDRSVVARR